MSFIHSCLSALLAVLVSPITVQITRSTIALTIDTEHGLVKAISIYNGITPIWACKAILKKAVKAHRVVKNPISYTFAIIVSQTSRPPFTPNEDFW
jgi:hypothetical protein